MSINALYIDLELIARGSQVQIVAGKRCNAYENYDQDCIQSYQAMKIILSSCYYNPNDHF